MHLEYVYTQTFFWLNRPSPKRRKNKHIDLFDVTCFVLAPNHPPGCEPFKTDCLWWGDEISFGALLGMCGTHEAANSGKKDLCPFQSLDNGHFILNDSVDLASHILNQLS